MRAVMNNSWTQAARCAALAALLCVPQMSWGQNDAPPSEPPPPNLIQPAAEAKRDVVDVVDGVTPDLIDPTFDRYVDLQLLGTAWRSGDAATLADLAFQFAEGERILHRSHKATKASNIMDIAIKMAMETNDKVTLSRLAKAAESSGDKARSAQLTLALKTASVSRAIDPVLTEGTQEELTAIAEIQAQLTKARLSANPQELAEIQKTVADHPVFNAKQKESLTKLVVEAKNTIPEKADPETANTIAVLEKLSGSSRVNWNPLSPENAPFLTWRMGPLGHYYKENFWFLTYEIWVWDYNEGGREVPRHLVQRGTAEWAKVLYGMTRANSGWRDVGGGKSAYVHPDNPCSVYMNGKWQSLPNEIIPQARIVAAGGGNIVAAGGGNLIGKGGAGVIALPNHNQMRIAVSQRSAIPAGQKASYFLITSTGIVAAGGGN